MLEQNRQRASDLIGRIKRCDDYGQLLINGSVTAQFADEAEVEAWRGDMRRQARADHIKIRTGSFHRVPHSAWACQERLKHGEQCDNVMSRVDLLSGAYDEAKRLGHAYTAIRHGQELVAACERCPVVGYIHMDEGIRDGDLFEHPCMSEEA